MNKKILTVAIVVVVIAIAVYAYMEYGRGHTPIDQYVYTVEDLDVALQAGDNAILCADLTFTERYVTAQIRNWDLTVPQGVSSTLNLNGHNLNFVSTWGIKVFGTLEISGDGTLTQVNTTNSVVAGAAGSDDAYLTIYGGTYINEGDSECILARDGAHVIIYDGEYHSTSPYVAFSNGVLLNLENTKNGSTITVYGGVFYGMDPDWGDTHVEGSYVPEGYVSKEIEDGVYTVVKA